MIENITLMIIDDDQDDIKLFVESANEVDATIKCITATDGLKGLKYLNDETNPLPDYIFLDLRMPKISGQKCLEEIKKVERLASIPVFVYTTSTDDEDIKNLQKLGAVMFISKPTNPKEIYYLLSSILGEKWS
jgi:CheY-like chemotaxis protein